MTMGVATASATHPISAMTQNAVSDLWEEQKSNIAAMMSADG